MIHHDLEKGTTEPEAKQDWDETVFHEWFHDCPDVKIEKQVTDTYGPLLLIYCENLCDLKEISKSLLPALTQRSGQAGVRQALPFVHLPIQPFLQSVSAANIAKHIFVGELIIASLDDRQLFTVNLANIPKRNPEESAIDISIWGPRDGFVEEYGTNLALIRKRFRSASLVLEEFTIGKRSSTKVGLMFVQDVINPDYVSEVRRRLKQICLDTLISPAQLENLIGERKFSFFPHFLYTGRPDFAIDCLSRGRFILIIEGTPSVMIGPANLFLILKTPEDSHFPFWITAISRIIRMIGLLISIFLPGFWIALTHYNQDQLPFPLLATITQTRIGLPLPSAIELFLMLFILDLFREAGSRLPRSVGQTLTVVGGIVIGDAAIRAAVISPILLVIAAISTVANFTLANQSLAGAISLLRLLIFFAGALLGMFGFIISVILLVLHLSGQRSFSLPYLAPFSPLSIRGFLTGVLAASWRHLISRPEMLHPEDSIKKD